MLVLSEADVTRLLDVDELLAALGERDEAERCQAFLRELAPDAPSLALPHSPAP